MNKLKDKIKSLKNYLGRDNNGLRLLEEVTVVANQIRKDLASATERELAAKRHADTVSAQLMDATSELVQLKKSIEQEQSLRMQREREIAALQDSKLRLEKQINDLIPEDLPALERTERVPGFQDTVAKSVVVDLKQVTDSFNQLRRQMRICPTPIHRNRRDNAAYELSDIIRDMSGNELMKLGRFVACQAIFNFPCIVQAETTIHSVHSKKKVPLETCAPFVSWLRRSINNDNMPFVPEKMGVPSYLYLQ